MTINRLKITKIDRENSRYLIAMEHVDILAKCGRGVKNGKGQKAKEEAKETVLTFLKLDTSNSIY